MAKFSVIVTTYNAEWFIRAALESATWADEIIVVDSGSTDATVDIAREFTCHVVTEPWRGYTAQKQYAVSLARNDWVFVLDQDEELSPELIREIQGLSDEQLDRHDLYDMPRRTWVMGRPVRAWWPDYQNRFFHRGRVTWADEAIHDRRIASSPQRHSRLRGVLVHRRYSQGGFRDYFNPQVVEERVRLDAEQMFQRGRRCHWWDLTFRPWIAFFRNYVIKRGFLDGSFGLLIAREKATMTNLRYAALWALQNGVPLGPR